MAHKREDTLVRAAVQSADKVKRPCTCYTGVLYPAPFPALDTREILYWQGSGEDGAGDGNRTHVASFKAQSLRNGLISGYLNGLDKFGRCRLLM